MFALADCNNFYASCERLFAPQLEGKPVVVLSNNDGCVIARSNEAKAIPIPMGAPYFKIESLIRQHHVRVYSSNYALYGDLSRRVMSVLADLAPAVEVYSIDECFLDFSRLAGNRTEQARRMVKTVKQWTGIPVSIGIAPTKTLAKLANRWAKKGLSSTGPVLDWTDLDTPDDILSQVAVEDLWGIAKRTGARLRQIGIADALALRDADCRLIRQSFGVTLERTVRELRGLSCIPLEQMSPPRKQIVVSRSFGTRLTDLDELRPAVASFAARGAEKLRTQRLCTQALSVFIHTNPFDTQKPGYANSVTLPFIEATQHSGQLITTALTGLKRIYRTGFAYQKAGIMLLDLVPERQRQGSLFSDHPVSAERTRALMAALDQINTSFGRQTIRYGSEAISDHWRMRQKLKSPAFTTRWDELPVVWAR